MTTIGTVESTFSKFPKINSREEKEMSSIKTLSSFSFPADVSKKNKNGDERNDVEDDAVADGTL